LPISETGHLVRIVADEHERRLDRAGALHVRLQPEVHGDPAPKDVRDGMGERDPLAAAVPLQLLALADDLGVQAEA
jgi:hypothetical protein